MKTEYNNLLKLKESVKSRFIAMVVLSGNLIRSLIDFYANTQFGVCLLGVTDNIPVHYARHNNFKIRTAIIFLNVDLFYLLHKNNWLHVFLYNRTFWFSKFFVNLFLIYGFINFVSCDLDYIQIVSVYYLLIYIINKYIYCIY